MLRHAEPVMGTVVSFAIAEGKGPQPDVLPVLRAACRVLHEADAIFSTYEPHSPMSRLRRGELALDDAPPVLAEVLQACKRVRGLSGGWFDPWAMPGGVDPTGLVKGWAAQRAAAELQAGGVGNAMINAAGDIVALGQPVPDRPWRVGIRDPRRPTRLTCVVPVAAAIATSAHYERPGQVLNPFDGKPAGGLLSATVVGPDLGIADALATGLLAAGASGLPHISALEHYSAYAIGEAGVIRVTPGFPPTSRPAAAVRASAGAT